MRLVVAAAFLCSPLLLSGCILAAAGAGAGAGVALSESEHHDGHETRPADQNEDSAAPPSSQDQAPGPAAAAPENKTMESETLPPPR
jgi:hypothetical protein